MAKFKRKIRFKSIISVILVIGAVVGLAAGVAAISKDKTKTLSSVGTFIRGGIDAKGEYVKGDTSIVTEEMFSCAGLTVTPKFNSDSTYQLFWYNVEKAFIGKTDVLKNIFTGELPVNAKYCRIVITPSKASLGNDEKINFYEVSGIASKFKIEIYKDQSEIPVNYYKEAMKFSAPVGENFTPSINDGYQYYDGYCCWIPDTNGKNFTADMDYKPEENRAAIKLDCSKVSAYKVFIPEDGCGNFGFGVYDAEGNRLGGGVYDYNVDPQLSYVINLMKYTNAKYIVFGFQHLESSPVINALTTK